MAGKKIPVGPILVATACFIWATDALVRYPAIGSIDPTLLIFIEHCLAILILLPWVLWKYQKRVFALTPREYFAAAFSGIGGSAIATVYFSASFLYVNPSVAVLLQKLQPVLVVVVAYPILGERPSKKFAFWGLVALAAGLILSFPDLDFKFLFDRMNVHSKGIHYAFFAALLWAVSTVSGKILLKRTPTILATFWRFFFGWTVLSLLLIVSKQFPSLNFMHSNSTFFAVLYLSLIPGLFGMLFYYAGLARTTASVTTFIELLYPIAAVALNTVFLHMPLGSIQTIAGIFLLFAVMMISR